MSELVRDRAPWDLNTILDILVTNRGQRGNTDHLILRDTWMWQCICVNSGLQWFLRSCQISSGELLLCSSEWYVLHPWCIGVKVSKYSAWLMGESVKWNASQLWCPVSSPLIGNWRNSFNWMVSLILELYIFNASREYFNTCLISPLQAWGEG